jgi:hypothetical protein
MNAVRLVIRVIREIRGKWIVGNRPARRSEVRRYEPCSLARLPDSADGPRQQERSKTLDGRPATGLKCSFFPVPSSSSSISRMIAPETFSHLEEIKKRAGHLWRFL